MQVQRELQRHADDRDVAWPHESGDLDDHFAEGAYSRYSPITGRDRMLVRQFVHAA